MLGRTLLRAPARSHLSRSMLCSHRGNTPQLSSVLPIRTYATPGRPKSVVGEPSRPVKRVVKERAAPSAGKEAAPEDEVSSKVAKRATRGSGKGAEAGGAAPAKARASQKKLTPAQRKKAFEKKWKLAEKKKAQKAVAKKRASKIKAKEKEKMKVDKKKAMVEELTQTALDAPKKRCGSAFIHFSMQAGKDIPKESTLKERVQEISRQWTSLSPAEKEHWDVKSKEENARSAEEYKKWVESHHPAQILAANIARKQLRKLFPNPPEGRWRPIRDHRAPKSRTHAYGWFFGERNREEQSRGAPGHNRAAMIGKEWQELSEEAKKPYEEMAVADDARFKKEFQQVYGHEPVKSKATARLQALKAVTAA